MITPNRRLQLVELDLYRLRARYWALTDRDTDLRANITRLEHELRAERRAILESV